MELRSRQLNLGQERLGQGPVIYWMHREHRARDNWGLLLAQARAVELGRPLAVAWCLSPNIPEAGLRQYAFLLGGLRKTVEHLEALGIPFLLLHGDPGEEIPSLARELDAALLTTDFDSLRFKRQWLARAAEGIGCPLLEVDSRNVVPCLAASDKREYAARTIRPKIHRLLPEFLDPFPELVRPPVAWMHTPGIEPSDLAEALDQLQPDPTVPEVDWITPGEDAGLERMRNFLEHGLAVYHESRNDPAQDGQSGLSAYLHFGMISAQRVALEALRLPSGEGREAFMEELVVRRELADNFCLHTPDYDRTDAFPEWARKTLDKHNRDHRPFFYGFEFLETARTHDPLWNAAQTEMLRTGRMHGWLRMYWAKKILEWSFTPEDAMARAVRLNDRWSLDGRDANGYAGIAWSIGGVHDRPWGERPVYGTVRYMNFAGAEKKFDVEAYIARIAELENGQHTEESSSEHPLPPVQVGHGQVRG